MFRTTQPSSKSSSSLICGVLILVVSTCPQAATQSANQIPVSISKSVVPVTMLDRTMTSIRYSSQQERFALQAAAGSTTPGKTKSAKHKSPLVAMGLSLLVPGAGQIYNGDYVFAAGFLGVEAGTWILNAKYNTDGYDKTEIFQNYNRVHWSETRYRDYLNRVYGKFDDDSIDATEISHNLPDDPNDQQYFEQTGKYDQFSWGWDDTYLDIGGQVLHIYDARWQDSIGFDVPAAKAENVPTSVNRLYYEDLRKDANDAFESRDRMMLVAALNRVVSSLHAYIVAMHRKKTADDDVAGTSFSHFDWSTSLKSTHAFADTPTLTMRWRF